MCGRFTLAERLEQLQKRYDIPEITYDYKPSYNIAPTDLITVVSSPDETKSFNQYRWGIPLKIEALNNLVINIRDDSITKNNFFSKMFENHRCLIPATGFFEWQKAGSSKIPFFIKTEENLSSFAGLYYKVKEVFYTAIITTDANSQVAKLHDRMPVIFSRSEENLWLQRTSSREELLDLLNPYPAELTSYYRVSNRVNSVKNNSPELVKPKPTSSLSDFF